MRLGGLIQPGGAGRRGRQRGLSAGRRGVLESEDGLSALQSAFQEPSNPHIEFFNSSTHGYNVMEVTPEKLTYTMFGVETTQQPPRNGQPQRRPSSPGSRSPAGSSSSGAPT